MVQIPLEGRSPVDACLEILKGKYASLVEGKYEDDNTRYDDENIN